MKENPNKKGATISNINLNKISTSKEGIGMYAVTFEIASRKYSQTRHLTEAQAKDYTPRIEVVQSGGRTLQKSSYKVEQPK